MMEDSQKTRGLLMDDLRAERRACDRAILLLRAAEYAFSHLPFDHASRRDVLRRIRAELQLPEGGSAASASGALMDLGELDARGGRR
jgi:hypothetical protein